MRADFSSPSTNTILELSFDTYQQMIDHLRSWLPCEGCGLLASFDGQVVAVYPGTNTEYSPIRYNMEPHEVYQALRDIDERGWELAAIFHSHPTTAAYPSSTDRDLLFDPNVLMVITSFAADIPDVRAFRDDGQIHEVPIRMTESQGAMT